MYAPYYWVSGYYVYRNYEIIARKWIAFFLALLDECLEDGLALVAATSIEPCFRDPLGLYDGVLVMCVRSSRDRKKTRSRAAGLPIPIQMMLIRS